MLRVQAQTARVGAESHLQSLVALESCARGLQWRIFRAPARLLRSHGGAESHTTPMRVIQMRASLRCGMFGRRASGQRGEI